MMDHLVDQLLGEGREVVDVLAGVLAAGDARDHFKVTHQH